MYSVKPIARPFCYSSVRPKQFWSPGLSIEVGRAHGRYDMKNAGERLEALERKEKAWKAEEARCAAGRAPPEG